MKAETKWAVVIAKNVSYLMLLSMKKYDQCLTAPPTTTTQKNHSDADFFRAKWLQASLFFIILFLFSKYLFVLMQLLRNL